MRVLEISALACALVLGLSETAEAKYSLKRLRSCLEFKDMTKPRLNCYDAIVPPEISDEPVRAKFFYHCRFVKDDNERLICFNRFVENQDKP